MEALSHELHSSKLEYLGVVAGIRSWCKEFGERQNMEIDFRSDVATVLPFEIGVCLFRVLQEALHNIVKHSGVKRVDVRLTEDSNQIHLRVSDSGKGFDVESTMQGKGLGLTSMRERVRLVNGTIAIESKPMGGTTIDVRVPVGSEHDSQGHRKLTELSARTASECHQRIPEISVTIDVRSVCLCSRHQCGHKEVTCQAGADKPLTLKNSFDSGQQVARVHPTLRHSLLRQCSRLVLRFPESEFRSRIRF